MKVRPSARLHESRFIPEVIHDDPDFYSPVSVLGTERSVDQAGILCSRQAIYLLYLPQCYRSIELVFSDASLLLLKNFLRDYLVLKE
jgi:hypothetical protein